MAIRRLLKIRKEESRYRMKLEKEVEQELTREEAEDLYNDIKDNPEFVLDILWTALGLRGDI